MDSDQLLDDDQARMMAEQFVRDIRNASDVDAAMSVYRALDGGTAGAVLVHLVPQLAAAVRAYEKGDRSSGTTNMAITGIAALKACQARRADRSSRSQLQ